MTREDSPLECPNCGGDIQLIAFITEPVPIQKILSRLGEPPPDGRNAQSRCSKAVRQPEDGCGSAIDRAILVILRYPYRPYSLAIQTIRFTNCGSSSATLAFRRCVFAVAVRSSRRRTEDYSGPCFTHRVSSRSSFIGKRQVSHLSLAQRGGRSRGFVNGLA